MPDKIRRAGIMQGAKFRGGLQCSVAGLTVAAATLSNSPEEHSDMRVTSRIMPPLTTRRGRNLQSRPCAGLVHLDRLLPQPPLDNRGHVR